MPYGFNFDLSRISQSFFKELTRVAQERKLHKKLGVRARYLAEKFRLQEITGLDVPNALQLVEDLIDMHMRNVSERKNFIKTEKRALFLPHCARKYMDNRCQAQFNSELPSYKCAHCSPDCIINQAANLGKGKGYDVYILPGGSCVPEILKKNRYEGVVGVSCSQELKLGGEYLKQMGLAGQAVPLLRNGCAKTTFNIGNLEKIL
jgi:hypothetical protein